MSHATATREQRADPPTPRRRRRRRRRRIVIAASAIVVLLIAVVMIPTVLRLIDDPAASDPAVGINEVGIQDNAFQPPVVQVAPGTAVTWIFDDGATEHNVVGDAWQSDVQTSGTYERIFDEPGSYPYTCTLHIGMNGRVEVVSR